MLRAEIAQEIHLINKRFIEKDHWGSLYEEITFALYEGVLGPGDISIDCGVNKGQHTQAMALKCGPTGTVFSFEPAPQMLEEARETNRGMTNIVWIDKAVCDVGGRTVSFNFYPNEHGLSSLMPRGGVSVTQELKVQTATIDESVAGYVSLIKLDIEGAEYHALLGAERVMAESLPVIVFENGRAESAQRFGYQPEEFFGLFSNRGYSLYSIAGMPFTMDLWDSHMVPFQYVAIHPGSPRAAAAYAVMHGYATKLA